ncbi:MAG: hypothetical protein M1837_004112 [Sclerophora amabilis]|nr:MAG: hypothetical protein M1837_004112 [Sclerophora amabilis]
MADQQNLWILAADNPDALLPLLYAQTSLASSQDFSGYSLVHAAASYNHTSLLRQLVTDFAVDVDIKDHDGETALFQVESVDVARVLVEELGASLQIRNTEGRTAADKIESEEDWPLVAAYLREKEGSLSNKPLDDSTDRTEGAAVEPDEVQAPPPLPPNVSINIGTMEDSADAGDGNVVDPDLKRRIEELADRDDFQSEEGQRELRNLITDAVREHVVDGNEDDRDVRRRTS